MTADTNVSKSSGCKEIKEYSQFNENPLLSQPPGAGGGG